jgi:uncharacterized repeat protein (TIGR01451 family)
MSLLLALTGLSLLPSAAQAAPVYQITGEWEAGTPTTVGKGDVVTGTWRVNVNDDQPAPANDPVDNVTFTVTTQHGVFKALPEQCKTTGVTPASSISADGRTLTCNVGTVIEGTAVVVQTPIVSDGVTGDEIVATGAIDGQQSPLSPIRIQNTFGMDMLWGTPSSVVVPWEPTRPGFDFEWTLFQDKGSDPGPDTVSYDLTVNVGTGQDVDLSQYMVVPPYNTACTPYVDGAAAVGHPWSGNFGPANQNAPFVQSCDLVKTGPNTFRLTLSGIDYSQVQVPTQDSAGNPMPTDKVAVASGSVWFEFSGFTASTGATLQASAPTYTSTTALTDTDDTSNNTSTKAIVLPGGWSHGYGRPGGGTTWDNSLRLAPGSDIQSFVHVNYYKSNPAPASTPTGACDILDTRFSTYKSAEAHLRVTGGSETVAPAGTGTFEWYVGGDPTLDPSSPSYDPNASTVCADTTGWVSTEPADKSTIKAVRWTSTVGAIGNNEFLLYTTETVKPDAPIGQDVWSWAGVLINGTWIHNNRETDGTNQITPVPGGRYPYTTGMRDVLHVVYALPAITKTADRSVLKPGEPATFTLTYSANGSGSLPATVDDYQIVDTLPAGMTYVAGSATPEPTLSTSAGHQVLTWDLDAVATNTPNTLTYQAEADSTVTPGQALTNTVDATLRGETASASAQVTVSTNGYTQIAKTADTPFIPNTDGKGNGAGSWTVSVRSFDPLPQAYTDVIDILPYRGDGRGTSYSGSYDLSGVDALAGQTVYYTDADPATLSDDPNATANGAANAPSGLWSTTMPAHPTAVRVIGPGLAPGAEQQFRINVTTHGAAGGDVYVNRAQGVAGHTELVMRTSAPMSVANYYSAALKKYVQDVKGAWHDANDVADYPAFRYGDVIRYRIVVTNTGQGTLHHVVVADDKQPALGGFSIDSLDPGKSESHEYSITLTKSVSGTVVNTATASADTPPDSQIPPTINSDPAGFEVANYATVKSAVPASGSALVPGQRVTYTVKVAQQGSAPAVASFTDDLAKVLDDATYNGDAKASIGKVSYANAHLVWSGTIPVGQVAVVTYSVTVKAVQHLGDRGLVNSVTSDGCAGVCSTRHQVARFDLKITKKVIGAKQVAVGHKVRYGLRVVNRGPDAAPGPIRVGDKLPKGLKLRAAHGSGWSCVVAKATRKVSCVRAAALAPGAKAPVITVVAKATKAAIGHRLVNTATVKAAGDTVRSNNHSKAAIRVIKKAPMWVPYNSYRLVPRERWLA